MGGQTHCLRRTHGRLDAGGERRRGRFAVTSGQWAAGWSLHIANLNGDKRADLLLYNPRTGAWAEATAQSPGPFVLHSGMWPAGLTVLPFSARRNSGDRDDVLLYSATTGQWTLVTTTSTGQAAAASGVWLPRVTLGVGDLDGDGRTDVFLYDPTTGRWSQGLQRVPGRFDYRRVNGTAGGRLLDALDGRRRSRSCRLVSGRSLMAGLRPSGPALSRTARTCHRAEW